MAFVSVTSPIGKNNFYVEKMASLRKGSSPSINLVKWWTKGYHEPGRITRHLSPFQQRPAAYLFLSMPEKAIRKVKENGLVLTGAAALLWGTVTWGNYADKEDNKTHWS